MRERVGLVNAKLKAASGESSLFINPKCIELIKDLEEVTYQKDSTMIDKMSDPKRTHLSDALGYLIWQESQGKNTVGPRNQRLI